MIHVWWQQFGDEISPNLLKIRRAQDLARVAEKQLLLGGVLRETRRSVDGLREALLLDLNVERPQDVAADIKRKEPVVIVFSHDDRRPDVRAVRVGFPRTIHQNYSEISEPPSLCIDDRPWPEAKLDFTSNDLVQRTQSWLARAAREELHLTDQPLEPIFYGNGIKVVISRGLLRHSEATEEMVAYSHDEQSHVFRIVPLAQVSANEIPSNHLHAIGFKPKWVKNTRMRVLPGNLDELAKLFREYGVDLLETLSRHIVTWTGFSEKSGKKFASRLLLIVAFPMDEAEQVLDVRGFLIADTAGNLGVSLGVLERNSSGVESTHTFVRRIPASDTIPAQEIPVAPVEIHIQMDRELGAAIAGGGSIDLSQTLLIGAGSLGSQLALNLAREGRYKWTIVDEDVMLPHNFARHGLFPTATGVPKADVLGAALSELLGDKQTAIVCDFLAPDAISAAPLEKSLKASHIVIDASASVAVSRHLADSQIVSGRRLSVFFNPTGTSLIVLCEDKQRNYTLRDLECQYHRLIQTDQALFDHLTTSGIDYRYSGSCRSATNRIPASNAALFSALAAKQLVKVLANDAAAIGIWSLMSSGEVTARMSEAEHVKSFSVGKWSIRVDAAFLESLAYMRRSGLPEETGGILLGIVDTNVKLIHVVHALPAPPDSKHDVTGFERGVQGLQSSYLQARERSMNQLRYIGEWHSHPDGSAVLPSSIDLNQFKWLTEETQAEEVPVLMIISGAGNAFAVLAASV